MSMVKKRKLEIQVWAQDLVQSLNKRKRFKIVLKAQYKLLRRDPEQTQAKVDQNLHRLDRKLEKILPIKVMVVNGQRKALQIKIMISHKETIIIALEIGIMEMVMVLEEGVVAEEEVIEEVEEEASTTMVIEALTTIVIIISGIEMTMTTGEIETISITKEMITLTEMTISTIEVVIHQTIRIMKIPSINNHTNHLTLH